jgi:hypothetical protein
VDVGKIPTAGMTETTVLVGSMAVRGRFLPMMIPPAKTLPSTIKAATRLITIRRVLDLIYPTCISLNFDTQDYHNVVRIR